MTDRHPAQDYVDQTKAEEAAKKVVPIETGRTYTLEQLDDRAAKILAQACEDGAVDSYRLAILVRDLIATLRAGR